jgi:3',5'-cyclic AMP phosphodiesterase CpdA
MPVLAHVSDLHLDGGPRATARAARVTAHLAGLPVDALLVTGDIADGGRPEEYAQARGLLDRLPYPVLTCPGNHDVRAAYRDVLLDGSDGEPDADGFDADGPVNRASRVGDHLVAMLDSTIPGQGGGHLADATLAWLDRTLSVAPDVPAVVACHHPPVALHLPYVDAIRQEGADRFAAVLAGHPQVVAVLCGHAHTAAATTFAGRPLRVGPGVASTSTLPWERGGLLDLGQPPGVAFHVVDDDGVTTHYRVVP